MSCCRLICFYFLMKISRVAFAFRFPLLWVLSFQDPFCVPCWFHTDYTNVSKLLSASRSTCKHWFMHLFIYSLIHSFIHSLAYCSEYVVIHFHYLYVVKSAREGRAERKTWRTFSWFALTQPPFEKTKPQPGFWFSYLCGSVWDFLGIYFLFRHGPRLELANFIWTAFRPEACQQGESLLIILSDLPEWRPEGMNSFLIALSRQRDFRWTLCFRLMLNAVWVTKDYEDFQEIFAWAQVFFTKWNLLKSFLRMDDFW